MSFGLLYHSAVHSYFIKELAEHNRSIVALTAVIEYLIVLLVQFLLTTFG